MTTDAIQQALDQEEAERCAGAKAFEDGEPLSKAASPFWYQGWMAAQALRVGRKRNIGLAAAADTRE